MFFQWPPESTSYIVPIHKYLYQVILHDHIVIQAYPCVMLRYRGYPASTLLDDSNGSASSCPSAKPGGPIISQHHLNHEYWMRCWEKPIAISGNVPLNIFPSSKPPIAISGYFWYRFLLYHPVSLSHLTKSMDPS